MRKTIQLVKDENTGRFNKAKIGVGRDKIEALFTYDKNRLFQIILDGQRKALPSNFELFELIAKLSLLEEQANNLYTLIENETLVEAEASVDGPSNTTLYTVPKDKKLQVICYYFSVAGVGASGTEVKSKLYFATPESTSVTVAGAHFVYRVGSDVAISGGLIGRPIPSGWAVAIYSNTANCRTMAGFIGVLLNG